MKTKDKNLKVLGTAGAVLLIWYSDIALQSTHNNLPVLVEPSAPASAGGTDRDLAWTQVAQKLGI
jgi:hypothetical protein